MESAGHLAQSLRFQPRGIHVLLWEDKADLVRALIIVKAVLPEVKTPIVLSPVSINLQKFSIRLFESEQESILLDAPRIIIIPQASTEVVGAWLNGWRRRLAEAPGTLIVIRRADFTSLCLRAPDLMSFAQSDVHEATGLLPLIESEILENIPNQIPDDWKTALNALPGEIPSDDDIVRWIDRIRSNVDE
jgi:hypothetical protein